MTRQVYVSMPTSDDLSAAIETAYANLVESTDLADVEMKADIDLLCAQLGQGLAVMQRPGTRGLGAVCVRELVGKLCIWMLRHPQVKGGAR